MRNQHHHVVTGIHGALEVMRDEQHSTPEIAPDLLDELMEPFRPREVDPLVRLIENQQAGTVDERPGKQQPLKLSAGEGRDRWVSQPLQTDGNECSVDFRFGKAAGEGHEPPKGQRERRADREALRDVTHLDRRSALDGSLVNLDET